MSAPFPTPSSTRTNGIRRPAHTRPGTSAFDKFPAAEFDAWIGGLTTRLKGALAFDAQALRNAPPPTLSRFESYGTTRPPLPNVGGSVNGVGEESGVMEEDSFADVRRRKQKGKMRDPREGPGLLGEGGKDQPIELLSDDEEEEQDESEEGEEEDEEEEGSIAAELLDGNGVIQGNQQYYEDSDEEGYEDDEENLAEDHSQRGSSPAYIDDAYYDSDNGSEEGSHNPSPPATQVKGSLRTRRVENEDSFLTDQIISSDEDGDASASANAHNTTLNDNDESREYSPADLGYDDDYEDDSHRPSDAENIPPPRSGPLFPSHTDEDKDEEEERCESPPFAGRVEDEDNQNLWDVQSDDEPLRHAPDGDEEDEEAVYDDDGQEPDDNGIALAPGRRILGDLDNGPHYDTLQRHVHGVGGYDHHAYEEEEGDEEEDDDGSAVSDEEEDPYNAFKQDFLSNPPRGPAIAKGEPEVFEILDSDEEEAPQPVTAADNRGYEDEDEESLDNAPTLHARPPAVGDIYGPRPSMSPDPEPLEMQNSSGLPVMHNTAQTNSALASESSASDHSQDEEPYKSIAISSGPPIIPPDVMKAYNEFLASFPPLPEEEDDYRVEDEGRGEIDNAQAVHAALESPFEHSEIVSELPVVRDHEDHLLPTVLGPIAPEGDAHTGRGVLDQPGDLGVSELGPEAVELDLPDPWVGPSTYAEDFYSGGDAAIFGLVGGEDASVLTPLPEEHGISLVLPGYDATGDGHILEGLRYPEQTDGAAGDVDEYLDYIGPDPALEEDGAPVEKSVAAQGEASPEIGLEGGNVQENLIRAQEEPIPIASAPAVYNLDDDELDYMDPEPAPAAATNAEDDTAPQHTSIPPRPVTIPPDVEPTPTPTPAQTPAERRSINTTTPSSSSTAFNPAFLASLIPPPTFSPAAVSDWARVDFSLPPVAPADTFADIAAVTGARNVGTGEGERSTEADASIREWLRDPVRVGATPQEMASGVEDVGPEPEVIAEISTTISAERTLTVEKGAADSSLDPSGSAETMKAAHSSETATTPIDAATAEQLTKDAGSPSIEPIGAQTAIKITAPALVVPGQDAPISTPSLTTPDVADVSQVRLGTELSRAQTTAPSESSRNSSNPQLPTPDSNQARPLPEETAGGSRTVPFGSHTPANMLLPEFSSHIKAVVAGAPLPHFDFGARTPPVPPGGPVSPYFAESSGGYFDVQSQAQAQPEQTPESVEDVEKTPVATVQAAPHLADLLRNKTESFEMLPGGSHPSTASATQTNAVTAMTIQEEGVSQVSLEEISQAGAIFPSTLSVSTGAGEISEEAEHAPVVSADFSPDPSIAPEIPTIRVEDAEEDKGEVISLAPTPAIRHQSLVPDEGIEDDANGVSDEVAQEIVQEAQVELDTSGGTLGLDLDGHISSLDADAPIPGLSRTPSLAGLLPAPASPIGQTPELPTVKEIDENTSSPLTQPTELADDSISESSRDSTPAPVRSQQAGVQDAKGLGDDEDPVTIESSEEPPVVGGGDPAAPELIVPRSSSHLGQLAPIAEPSQAPDERSPEPVKQPEPSSKTATAVETIATVPSDDSELVAPATLRKAGRRTRRDRHRSRTHSRPLNDGSDADAESDSSDEEGGNMGTHHDVDDIMERRPAKRRRMREPPSEENASQTAEKSLPTKDAKVAPPSGSPVLGGLPAAALSAPALIPVPEEEEDPHVSALVVDQAKEDNRVEDIPAVDKPDLAITIPEVKKATSTAKADVLDDDDSQDEAHITKTLAAETDDDEPATATPTTANASPARPSLTATQTFSLPEVPLAQRGNVYHQHVQKSNNTGVTQLPGRQIGPRRPPPPARTSTLSIPTPVTVFPTAPATPSAPSAVSPTLSQDSQAPLSQASQSSTATHTEPTNARRSGRASRSMAMKSAPVTRSHCKYHKISFELSDGGPRVLFVVPGCVLVNTEFMFAEDIIDQGDAEVEDMNRIEAGIDTLDISDEVISNLKLLVGVDVLREIEVFYLPQDDVPIRRKRRKVTRVPDSLTKNRRKESLASIPRAGPSGVKRKRDEALSASQRFFRGSDDDSASVGRRGSTDGSVRSTPMPTPTPKQLGSRSPSKGRLKVVGTRSPPPAFHLHKSAAAGPSGSQSQRAPARVPVEVESTVSSEESSLSAEEADKSGVYVPTAEVDAGRSTGSDTSFSGRPSQAKRKRKRKSHLDIARGAEGAKKKARK